jgi:hypothetical protein
MSEPIGPGNPPAEHRFKPGQSGNPGGRSKGRSITAAINKLLEQEHQGKSIAALIAERLVKDALQGKFPQAKEILDRSDGRVTEKHLVAAQGTQTIRLVVQDASGNEREVSSLREFYRACPAPVPPPLPEMHGGVQ